jgi:tetratricopeptide (TPR) repeat protein
VARCEEQDFDIILCDYNLGSGKNGQQVLEELRFNRLLKHTSIFVMVTAETSKDMVMGALEYLPDAYITKPLTKAVLQTRLDKLIEQREVLKPINTAIDEEQIEKAILLLDQEIKRDSRYILWCLRTTANLYFSKGDFPKARSIYEQVLSKKDIGWAKLGLGRVRVAQGQYQEAVADFKGLLDHNPNLIEAYDNLANAYLKLGLRKEAQNTLKDAATISPHAILRQKKLAEVSNENQD